jgi:TonB family protein
MGRLVALSLLAMSIAMAQVVVTGPEGDCGFARLQPVRISHYVERGALAKVTPQYPPAAKAGGIVGNVRVRVLINKQGLVERTCPEFVKDEPRPDRSLVIAAEAAALQWSFDPNFGFGAQQDPRFKYAQGVLVFDFVAGAAKDRSERK